MADVFNLTILSLVYIPIGTALLLIFIDRLLGPTAFQKNLTHTIAVFSAFIDLALAVLFGNYLYTFNVQNGAIFNFFLEDTSLLTLRADLTSTFFMLIFTLVHFAVTVYCVNYMHHYDELGRFYALLFSVVAGLNLIVMVQDYFTLFVVWEAMVICAYAMVGFYRSQESSEAGFKYLMMSSSGSVLVLYGVALLYGVFGRLDFEFFRDMAMNPLNHPEFPLAARGDNYILLIALVLMLVGFGITAAMFFLNTWLPDAHPAAPPPAHAMLSGIIVIAGTYGILRTFVLIILPLDTAIFGNAWSLLLITIGILTSLQGNLFVLIQFKRTDPKARNLKRIFAFSTISHMGYLITALGAANVLGFSAVLFHAFNHAVAKGVLFMITGYLIFATKSFYLDNYKGFGRRDPVIGSCVVIGLFSLASIPLTGGFWSKLQLIFALADFGTAADHTLGLILATYMLVFSFLAAVGYLLVIKYLIFMKSDQDQKYIDGFDQMHAPFMKAAFVFLAIIVLVTGFLPTYLIDYALQASLALFGL